LIFYFQYSFAQKEEVDEIYIHATSYKIKDGLPSNIIQDIVQDEEGFLWLATQDGLSRFDSSSFINFSKDKSNIFSLPDNLVEDIILMPGGELWMSIYEVGITVFDQKSFDARSIKNTQSSLFKLPNSNLYGIDKDKDNNMWFSLYGEGIYQWNIREEKFYKHLSSDEKAWLTSKQTFEIMVDKKNRLWVCSIDSKVFLYDIETGESKEFNFSTDVNDPGSNPVYGFTESNNGEVYAGGYSGVFKYNESTQEFDHIVTKSMISKFYDGERKTARRILMDSNDNLWIGTSASMLLFTDNTLKRVLFYENNEVFDDQWTVKSIFEGSDGNIWLGTRGMGLIKVSADWERYNVTLTSFHEGVLFRRASISENNIWLVHESSDLEQYEYTNGQLTLNASIPSPLGIEQPRIDIVYQDEPNYIWISSSIGINKINIKTKEISTVLNGMGRKLGAVKHFYRDSNKRFYFYLFTDKQMGYFDETDMTAHMIENTDENSFKGSIVNQLSMGIDGTLWLATNGGIESFDMQSHQFNQIYKTDENKIVSSFYIDEANQDVWIIVDGGLYQLKWTGDSLVAQEDRFSKVLPKIIFEKVADVTESKILITTEDSGLVEINSKSLKHSVFSAENGLQSNRIINVLFPNNTPLIVTELGLALQNKDFKSDHHQKPKVIIDRLALGDVAIDLEDIESLVLDHNYGSIDFDVALISYVNTSIIEYQYMLRGLNDSWVNRGNDNKFSFLNLGAGKYDFKVRGRSQYGEWSNIESFSFKVKPAPWKSLWAYFIYGLLLMGLIYWLLYLYRRKILYEHEITEQQTQKQIAKAASKAKSDFLARVSHEIRTPLNGVLGMGELMLDTNMDEEQRIYADSIMASGQHLLEIINDILDLSKIEAGKLELEYKSFDLLLLVDEIVGVFTSQSKQKKLLFSCVFSKNVDRNRIGDAIRIKQILFNLLSNAFKFTKEGQVALLVDKCEEDENTVIFKVVDTGLGVDNKYVEELFQPFVQADTAITRKYGGTGLGLAIVKQLVEKMNGTISAQGKIYQGSIFEAKIMLKIDESKKQIMTVKSDYNVCLLINQTHLKNSLMSFLNILGINHSDQIDSMTNNVFVDALAGINKEHIKQLSNLKNTKTRVNFIGFSGKYIDKKLLNKINISRIFSPPITFSKIKNTFLDNENVETIKQSIFPSNLISKSLSLLVVEDNRVNQQVSIEMLEKMDHMVDVVDNAEEALTMLERNNYDMLLLDYHLPMMDGLSMVKVWKNENNIPVIIITADLTDEVMQNCLKLNIDNIVAKPFTQHHLSIAIEKALNKTHN